MMQILSNIKGKFVLSYNDCETARELYKNFTIIPVERDNNLVRKANHGNFKELIIKNF